MVISMEIILFSDHAHGHDLNDFHFKFLVKIVNYDSRFLFLFPSNCKQFCFQAAHLS